MIVDLRSDTVTRPTPAMRRAMAEAEVGDDVFAEDPTIRALEEETARLLGKEAALFVPSGTMANQIGLSLLAGAGSEIVVESDSHVFNYEAGAASALWGITLRPIPGRDGRITPDAVAAELRPPDEHVAPVRAVAIENTHNRHGGAVWPLEELDAMAARAKSLGLSLHLDGARLWNAAVASGVEVGRLARGADTVSVCFSKGLGAPVGSALASTAERIRRGRGLRKRLGGGMRQGGIIAAGALHAVRHHRERLEEDHRRAARLAEAFAAIPGIRVLPAPTNIVIAELAAERGPAPEAQAALGREGVLVFAVSPKRLRCVTHLEVDDAGIDAAIAAVRRVFRPAAVT
jgi:threonine aldolase